MRSSSSSLNVPPPRRVTSPFANLSSLSYAASLDAALLARRHQIIALCASSEAELENYWATKIVEEISMAGGEAETGGRGWPWSVWRAPVANKHDVKKALQHFPYLKNYQHLVSLEYHLLLSLGADFSQTIFLGSGPLPLSSLLLASDHLQHAQSTSCAIINIDQDLPSLTLGARLTSSILGGPLSSSLSLAVPTRHGVTLAFISHSALAIPPAILTSTSVLILAALVGLSPAEKNEILLYLLRHLPVGAFVLLRSAEGLRGLVYPVVDVEGLLSGAEERRIAVKEVRGFGEGRCDVDEG